MDARWMAYIFMVVFLVIVAAVIYVAAKKGYKDDIYKTLYKLVNHAEQHFVGNGRGTEKKAWVVDKIHEMLPSWAKIFISEKDIDNLIELAVTKMKEFLANQVQED